MSMSFRSTLLSLFAAVSLIYAGAACAQAPSAQEFHSRILKLYSFQPHSLGKNQLSAKSAELDNFWSYAKTNAKQVLPLLRSELANGANPSFFYYDGAKLLLSLSNDKADRALALRSLPKADLLDVENSDYLETVHWFASNGFDTRDAAFKILAYPDFKAFIPQHVLTLGQDYSLIYMLFPLQDVPYQRDLVERLAAEHDVRAQKSLLLSLWYTVTPEGLIAIKQFSERPGANTAATDYAHKLLARHPGTVVPFSPADPLRIERAKLMQRPISDEALIEFDSLTAKLLAKQ